MFLMEEMMLVQLNVGQLRSIVQNAVDNALNRIELFRNSTVDDEESDILYVNDVCQILNIQPPTVYAKTSKKEIPHYKKGGRLYFSRNELQKWLLNGKSLTTKEREELSFKKLLLKNRSRTSMQKK